MNTLPSRVNNRHVRRLVTHLLLVGLIVSVAFLCREWAYGTTYRLLLDQRVDNPDGSGATQRFDLEDSHVVPLIFMRDDRVAFRAALQRGATLRAEFRPSTQAGYTIRSDGRVVCRGDGTAPAPLACEIPAGSGTIDVMVAGEASFADLRLERDLHVIPAAAIAVALAVALVLTSRRRAPPAWKMSPAGKQAWAAIATVLTATLVGVLIVEGALRLTGNRLSQGIRAARHDLGEPTPDPRWQQSARYGQRLAVGFRGVNVWRDGDIIRMGFVPPALSEGKTHLYEFQTDDEGFRNRKTRTQIDIAALGDSFTDAQTVAIGDAWPQQLERRLGVAVQNYGTAGFGPQQELLALQDFAIRHSPELVILAFFAGNDLRDAEVFEMTGGTHNTGVDRRRLGWPIKTVVTRADQWFLVSAMSAASAVLASGEADTNVGAGFSRPAEGWLKPAATSVGEPPLFDRGVFSVEVSGRPLRWAFMPPYLNLLRFSGSDFEHRQGWDLTRRAIREMQRTAQGAGAELVVMFVPFKSQVYLPLLDRSMPRADLTRALEHTLKPLGTAVDVDTMLRNRLALNAMMAGFCRDAGIPLLDTTEPLRSRVEAGEAMFFPDDSHLNEAGEAALAEMLAQFLRDRGWSSRPEVR